MCVDYRWANRSASATHTHPHCEIDVCNAPSYVWAPSATQHVREKNFQNPQFSACFSAFSACFSAFSACFSGFPRVFLCFPRAKKLH